MPVTIDVIEDIKVLVAKTLQAQPEDVEFGVGMVVMPNPQQPGHLQSGVAIYLSIKGGVLGTYLNTTGIITPFGYNEDNVGDAVRSMLDELLSGRSKQLAAQEGQAEDVPDVPRLLLPGDPLV